MPDLQPVEERTFETGERSRLFLSLPRADVRLKVGEPGRVQIALEAAGESLAEAQEFVEQTRLRMRFQERTVKVEAQPPPPEALRDWCELSSPVFRVEVALPPVCHVDAAIFGGRMAAEDLEGHLILNAQGGTLVGSGLTGRVDVTANATSVELDDIRGKHLRLKCARGRAEVRDVRTKKATFTFASMEAEMAQIKAATHLDIADATCSVRGVEGKIDAIVRAGRLAVHLTDAVPVQLRAVRGALALDVPADLSAQLQLEGQAVTFEGAVAFEGERTGQRVVGELNGGGEPLTAHAVRGEVSLTANDGT